MFSAFHRKQFCFGHLMSVGIVSPLYFGCWVSQVILYYMITITFLYLGPSHQFQLSIQVWIWSLVHETKATHQGHHRPLHQEPKAVEALWWDFFPWNIPQSLFQNTVWRNLFLEFGICFFSRVCWKKLSATNAFDVSFKKVWYYHLRKIW